MTLIPDWTEHGACSGDPHPDDWFPKGSAHDEQYKRALNICNGCPVKALCYKYAKDEKLIGIWGGHHFGVTQGRIRRDGMHDRPTPKPRKANQHRPGEALALIIAALNDTPDATAPDIARRLGYTTPSAIRDPLRRAGRRDLLDLMASNGRARRRRPTITPRAS